MNFKKKFDFATTNNYKYLNTKNLNYKKFRYADTRYAYKKRNMF